MNYPRTCDGQRQPCPSPWSCTTGCNFTNAVLPKQSAQERAAAAFWAPDLPIQFVGPEPDEAIQPDTADEAIAWFQRWAKHIAVACFVIAAVVTYFGRAV